MAASGLGALHGSGLRSGRDHPPPLAGELLELRHPGDDVAQLGVGRRQQQEAEEPPAVPADLRGGQPPGEQRLRRTDREGVQRGQHEARHEEVQPVYPAHAPGQEPEHRDDEQRDPRVDLTPPEQEEHAEAVADRQLITAQPGLEVAPRDLEPALRPPDALVPQRPERGRGQLVGQQPGIVDDGVPVQDQPDRGVDVLGEHLGAHPGLVQNAGAPVPVRPAEHAEPVQAGPSRMAHRVDRLELDRHRARHQRRPSVADDAVALHDVSAVGDPAPRAGERVPPRVVVGVEDRGELALDHLQGRVDVLRLRRGERHLHHLQPPVHRRHRRQVVLHLHRMRRVVGQDHLQPTGIVLGEDVPQGLDDRRRLVGEVGRNDHRCLRVRRRRTVWRPRRVEGPEVLHPDHRRGEDQRRHHDVVRGHGEVDAEQVGADEQQQRHPDADREREQHLQCGPQLRGLPRALGVRGGRQGWRPPSRHQIHLLLCGVGRGGRPFRHRDEVTALGGRAVRGAGPAEHGCDPYELAVDHQLAPGEPRDRAFQTLVHLSRRRVPQQHRETAAAVGAHAVGVGQITLDDPGDLPEQLVEAPATEAGLDPLALDDVQRDDGGWAATSPRANEHAAGFLEPFGGGAQSRVGGRDAVQGDCVVVQRGEAGRRCRSAGLVIGPAANRRTDEVRHAVLHMGDVV